VTEEPAPDHLLGLLLRLVHQHWIRTLDAEWADTAHDTVRPPHANVLPLVPAEGIQVSALAQLARVRKQTMVQTVEQLERFGYVERRPDPTDRRARLVCLTGLGERLQPPLF
jgi:DNA-binding MarR family transcriptional regulator